MPTMPFAPGRLSTTKPLPSASPSFCTTTRPMTSVACPGGNGMTTRTGFVGYAWPIAAGGTHPTMAAAMIEIAFIAPPRRSHAAVGALQSRPIDLAVGILWQLAHDRDLLGTLV